MQIRRFIKFWICVFCFCCLLFIGIYTRGRLAEASIEYMCWLESKSADTDSISHAYQNLCMTEQCKEEPANSAITSKPSIQNSPISSRLLLNVLLDVDRFYMTFDIPITSIWKSVENKGVSFLHTSIWPFFLSEHSIPLYNFCPWYKIVKIKSLSHYWICH